MIKLSDFGMSKEMSGTMQAQMTAGIGTQGWRSPEVVRGEKHIKVSWLSPTVHQIGDNKPVKPAPRQGIYGPCPPLGMDGVFRSPLLMTVLTTGPSLDKEAALDGPGHELSKYIAISCGDH